MMKESKQISNRQVKSSAFTVFFSDPKNAADLYSALDDTETVTPEDIAFTTLSGVLFMARKNDLAFTVKNRVLVISEHQATINSNMPLRDAIYYGRTMEKLIEPKALYRTDQLAIPTPQFFVFYNGDADFPAEKILKLSDAYIEKDSAPMLELYVRVININLPVNHPILERCRPLYEYSWFIQKIKDYIMQGLNRDEAIIQTMEDCAAEGIMVEFIREHGTEAVNMLFTQFNMDDALEVRFEEGISKGERLKLISQVRKKFQKGLSSEQIAELLEEDSGTVQKIYTELQDHPDLNDKEICRIIQGNTSFL